MPAFLIAILAFFAKDFIRSALIGAGIGLFTSGISLIMLNRYIAEAQTQFSNMGGGMGAYAGLLGIAGIDKCISILIGALVCRATMEGLKLSLGKLPR